MAFLRLIGIVLAGAYAYGAWHFYRALPLLTFTFADTVFALATLGLVLLVLSELVVRGVTRHTGYRSGVRLAVITIVLMLLGTEAWLRYGWGHYASAHEKNEGTYRTLYQRIDQMKHDARQQRYYIYPAHLNGSINYPEFQYELKTNAIGLRGPEVDAQPAPGTFRIITIGDSFTEGFGVNDADAWPRQLERMLASQAHGQRVEAVNAAVAGSDPVFGYTLLEEVLAPMRPNLVIQAVSSNDVQDLCQRGGFERYRPDGSIVFKPGPSWEWLYGISFIARHVAHDFLGYNGLMQRFSEQQTCFETARATLREVIDRSCRLAKTSGFSLAVVVNPMVYEVTSGRYELDDLWEGNPPACANVLWLRHWFAQQGINPDNTNDFYYPIDRHHTVRGNRVFAEGVMEHIIAAGLFPAIKSTSLLHSSP